MLTGQRLNRSGFPQPDRQISKSTPVDRFLTGSVDRFFTESFCSLFNVSNKKFSKSGGSIGKVLKFVTSDEGLRKKTQKSFSFFAKLTQF